MTHHPIGDSIEDLRDVTVCTSLRAESKGYRMRLTGLILIAAIASPATSTAYGAGSSIRLTDEVRRELTHSPRPAPPASPASPPPELAILEQGMVGGDGRLTPPPPAD